LPFAKPFVTGNTGLLVGNSIVITDHKPLENLNLKAWTDEELGDLVQELLQFDFEVIYHPSLFNSKADCLSQNPVLDAASNKTTSSPILPYMNFFSLQDTLLTKFSIFLLSSAAEK